VLGDDLQRPRGVHAEVGIVRPHTALVHAEELRVAVEKLAGQRPATDMEAVLEVQAIVRAGRDRRLAQVRLREPARGEVGQVEEVEAELLRPSRPVHGEQLTLADHRPSGGEPQGRLVVCRHGQAAAEDAGSREGASGTERKAGEVTTG